MTLEAQCSFWHIFMHFLGARIGTNVHFCACSQNMKVCMEQNQNATIYRWHPPVHLTGKCPCSWMQATPKMLPELIPGMVCLLDCMIKQKCCSISFFLNALVAPSTSAKNCHFSWVFFSAIGGPLLISWGYISPTT